MAAPEQDGIKPLKIVAGAVCVGVLFAGGMFASSTFDARPPAPEKITMSVIEPAAVPPEATEISDRIRTFFMKGNVEECMQRHLGKDSRVEVGNLH